MHSRSDSRYQAPSKHAENKQKFQWLERGKHVWLQKASKNPEDVFLQAKVLDFKEDSDKVQVQLLEQASGFTTTLDNCFKLTYGPSDVSDMVDLEELNEPELLYNIKRRYFNDVIFTYCGPTLLIINPYCKIERLFNEQMLNDYQTLVFSESLEYKSQAPHIYGLAGFCLWQLFDNCRNQSIVISGESGAGKTENTKYCLNFLASLGRNMKEQWQKKGSAFMPRGIDKIFKKISSKLTGIEDRILGCNEILEAFGNAKTIRNDNSSRFGKLIILLYGETQVEIKSAFITNYLLEKSRIVSLADGERNYHIFYYFCKGASPEERTKYRLTEPPTGYYFLNQSSVYEITTAPGKTDEDLFQVIKTEFQLYLNPQEIEAVLSIVAAVLNMGNVRLKIKENQKRQECVVIQKENFLVNAAELIHVQPNKLAFALSYKTRVLAGTEVHSPLRLEQALALRDSFSKNLYQKLFNYLVFKLNDKIQLQKIDMDDLSQNRATRKSIGILDIFGFEILKRNSLEQFFINFANEKLQQLYVSYIFKEEENEFLKQGLKEFAYEFDFEDNKPIIDLIENYPLGVLHLINESSQLNKPDTSLPQSFVKNHPKTDIVTMPRSKPEYFQVNHSCSPVEYNVIGFTSKNKDEFPAQMLEIVSRITNQTLHGIINFDSDKSEKDPKANKIGKKFLGTKFLQQMNRLVEELHSCDCHFVRCIKPNDQKKSHTFNSASVLQSLRNLGVLDSIRIRKLGYVYRRPYHQFYKKFYEIRSYNYNYSKEVEGKTEDDFKELSKRLVSQYAGKELTENHILIGKQKIMIKEASLNVLEALAKEKRRLRVNVANRIKAAFRRGRFRQGVNVFFRSLAFFKVKMQQFKSAITEKLKLKRIVRVQRKVKQYLIDARFKKIRQQATKSAYVIGKTWRMVIQRRKYLKMRAEAIHLQACVRMYLTTVKFYKQKMFKQLILELFQRSWREIQNIKAIEIQRRVRGWLTRIRCKQQIADIQRRKQQALLRIKVTRIQKWWRYKMFQRALDKYRHAAQVIQANWRRKLLSAAYKRVKKSALVIQKAVRKHLHKRYYCSMHWQRLLGNFQSFELTRLKQLTALQLSMKLPTSRLHIEQASNRIQSVHPAETCQKYAGGCSAYTIYMEKQLNNSESNSKFLAKPSATESMAAFSSASTSAFNISLNQSDRNDYQCYIVDMDIVSDVSQYYDQWTVGYRAVVHDMVQHGELPLRIDISENFTLVTSQKGRVYSFGQIQPFDRLYSVLDIEDPYRIVCNEFSGYIFTTDRKLYVWGDNYAGELMLGHQRSQKGVVENRHLPVERLSDLEVKGSGNKYLLANGRVYDYAQPQNQSKRPVPNLSPDIPPEQFKLRLELIFPEKIEVRAVVASKNFVHFLANNGSLYSKGNNTRGQLGLGHTNKVGQQPVLNTLLRQKKELVECVSVGFKHTVCRTRLGYGYAWGDNSCRQVGGAQPYYPAPKLIDIDKPNNKCLQLVAGFRCSYILLENLRLYGWGTASTLNLNGTPTRIEYEKMFTGSAYGSNDLLPVKLSASWSNSLCIVYINAIHLGKCRKTAPTTRELITKTVRQFSKDWLPNAIMPPYSENAETHLNLAELKKFKFKPPELRPSQYTSKPTTTHSVQEVQLLVELRRSSTTFSMTAKEKFQDILSELLKKDVSDWTEDDRRMYEYLQNPKIQQVLKKL